VILKNIKNYEFRAILLAPLMAGPALLLTEFQLDAYLDGEWWLLLIPPMYSTLLVAPFSYAAMLVFGIPYYLLLREFNLDKFWIISLSGLPIGIVMSYLIAGFDVKVATVITTCSFMISITAAIIIALGKKKSITHVKF